MKQLFFDFFEEDNYNINNFIVFNENLEAYYFLNRNKEDENILTNQLIFLSGGKKCGKTHLGQIWKQKHNAKVLNYNDIFSLDFGNFIDCINKTIEKFDYYLLDNLGNNFDEDRLFYLLNSVLNNSSAILIISEFNLAKKKIKIKDLKSRINSGINLKIKKLSKEVKTMLINKLFIDKHISVSGDILKYLTKKLKNDYELVYNDVNFIINSICDGKNKLSLAFVKNIFSDEK